VRQCVNGRYSMDVTLVDEGGEVVAFRRRAELVLGEEWRSGEGGKGGGKARI